MNEKVIQAFMDDHQARYSPATIRSYNLSLNQFFVFVGKKLDEVKASDVRAWLAVMEEKGLKPRTVQLKLSALKTFYLYCMEENKVLKNPTLTVRTPQTDDSLPYYLSKRQVALLQELTKNDPRDRAIVETLLTTGVRIGELVNIRLEDIKWEKTQIWIRKGKGTKERYVLFTHDCAERLKTYLQQRKYNNAYLFSNNRGGYLSSDYIRKKFQGFTKELGFKVTPHTMRHTFAAHFAEKNVPQTHIQELLGHVNLNSTRIYTRLKEHARKKQYDKFQG